MPTHRKEPEEMLEATPAEVYELEFPPRPARTRVRASRKKADRQPMQVLCTDDGAIYTDETEVS